MADVIRVAVTADLISDNQLASMPSWAQPVVDALENLTGQQVEVDSDSLDGHIATIGQGAWTIVVDLPAAANEFLLTRWEGRGPGEPFEFEIEIPTWVSDLVRLNDHAVPA